MTPILAVKLSVDLLMTVLFLLCFNYPLIHNLPHEILGTALGICLVAHNALNGSWYRHLGAGKYTPFRSVLTAVNLLLLLMMAGMIISGVMLSRNVFAFLGLAGSWTARRAHPFFACWSLVLLGVHLGLNGGLARLFFPRQNSLSARCWAYSGAGVITLYGLYAFIRLDLADKLLLQSLHIGRGANSWVLLADYTAILFGTAFITYQLVKWFQRKSISKGEKTYV